MISVTDRLLLGAAHSELVTDLNPITDPIQFLEWYRTVPGLISEAELVLEFRALLDRAFSRCSEWTSLRGLEGKVRAELLLRVQGEIRAEAYRRLDSVFNEVRWRHYQRFNQPKAG